MFDLLSLWLSRARQLQARLQAAQLRSEARDHEAESTYQSEIAAYKRWQAQTLEVEAERLAREELSVIHHNRPNYSDVV